MYQNPKLLQEHSIFFFFDSAGLLILSSSTATKDFIAPWNNGSAAQTFNINLSNLTQFSSASSVTIGTVEN